MNIIHLKTKIVCISFLSAPMLVHLFCLSTVMHCLLMTRVISDDQGDTREIPGRYQDSTGLVLSQIRASQYVHHYRLFTPVHFSMAEDDNESKATAAF